LKFLSWKYISKQQHSPTPSKRNLQWAPNPGESREKTNSAASHIELGKGGGKKMIARSKGESTGKEKKP